MSGIIAQITKQTHHKCIPKHTHAKVPNMLAMHAFINDISMAYFTLHSHNVV